MRWLWQEIPGGEGYSEDNKRKDLEVGIHVKNLRREFYGRRKVNKEISFMTSNLFLFKCGSNINYPECGLKGVEILKII